MADAPRYCDIVQLLTVPKRVEQLLLADDVVAMLDQIPQCIEDFGLQLDPCPGPAELAKSDVELELAKGEEHEPTYLPFVGVSNRRQAGRTDFPPRGPCRALFVLPLREAAVSRLTASGEGITSPR
jgi:hypothetical protein